MFMFKRLIILVAGMVALAANARDMRQLLATTDSTMDAIFLGQPRNLRLDMVDYFEAGSDAYVKDELTGSKIRIAELSDNHVRIETSAPVAYDFYLFAPGSDSLTVDIVSAPIGAGDDEVIIEDIRTGTIIQRVEAEYSEWLNPAVVALDSGKTDERHTVTLEAARAAIPFVTVSASFDPAAGVITLTNRSLETPGLDPAIIEAFIPTKTFRWNGRKFVLKK